MKVWAALCSLALFGCGSDTFVSGDGGGGDGGGGSDGGGGGDGGGDGGVTDGGVDGCVGATCGGQCVNTFTNNQNCGACGHVCSSGQCAGGACPLLPNTTVLADPACLAIDANSVYFTNGRPINTSGGVFKVPLTGGGPMPIANMGVDVPRGIAVDSGYVYFAANGAIWLASTGMNPSPSAIVSGQASPGAVALDANHLYWTSMADGVLWRADKDGGNPSPLTLATASSRASGFQSLAIDAANHTAYWTDPNVNSIARFDVNVAPPQQAQTWVGSQARPLGIALSGATLHWANANGAALMRGSTQNQNVTQALGNQTGIHSVATDGTNVYFSYQGGIRRTPLGGGNASTVAQAQNPTCLAVNQSFVFFMSAGQIWRAPK